jgi:hypothetical protein
MLCGGGRGRGREPAAGATPLTLSSGHLNTWSHPPRVFVTVCFTPGFCVHVRQRKGTVSQYFRPQFFFLQIYNTSASDFYSEVC